MKIKSYYLSLITSVLSMFLLIFSCSDDSDDPKDTSNDTFFSLSPTDQQNHWLNSKGLCSIGWDLHPYKECSKEEFGVKSYNEMRSEACGIESEKHDCKSCRHKNFGIESTVIKKEETIHRDLAPITIDLFAPYKNTQLLRGNLISSARIGPPTPQYKYEYSINYSLQFTHSSLPNINDYCNPLISQLKTEFQKQYPNHIINLNFISGNFKLPSHQLFQDAMLQNIRVQRLSPYTGTRIISGHNGFNDSDIKIDRNITFYPSCDYSLRVYEPTYKEGKSCELCGGSIDEIIYNLCRDPSHGVEKYNTKKSIKCGVNEDITIRSYPTTTKQQVEQNEGKIVECKTCDDITFDSLNMDDEKAQNAITEKIKCLKNNLNSTPEEELSRYYIIRELERLKPYSNTEEE